MSKQTRVVVKEASGPEIAYMALAVMESENLDQCYQKLQAVLGHLYFVYRGGNHISIHKSTREHEPRLALIVEEAVPA